MARNTNKDNGKSGDSDPDSVNSYSRTPFEQEVMKMLLYNSFEENYTRLGETLTLMIEMAKCVVHEICLRASSQALRDNSDKVDLEHVEKCLPQFMLDFP